MFESIDFKGCRKLYCEDSYQYKEDLLLLLSKDEKLIDVGWYNENKFCIKVVQGRHWDKPCYQLIGIITLEQVEYFLQEIIDFEIADYDPKIYRILKELIAIIDNWGTLDKTMDDLINLLHQLHDIGAERKKVANFIKVNAFKYEDNEERFDISCELVDIITGFCAPCFHIWQFD